MFVKNSVNIDDDDNDNDEKKSSFDRRCILLELASDVERNASKGLRVLSENKKNVNTSNEVLIQMIIKTIMNTKEKKTLLRNV
jgi:hypothetical protein